MDAADWAAWFCLLATVLQLFSTALVAVRCRVRPSPLPPPETAPPVTLIRPVCGIDNYAGQTLASGFGLDYPDYRLVSCAARPDDPAVPLVRELILAHPRQPAVLLIGDDRICANPKLNNVVKGWREATTEWIIVADSNVLMPRDYIQRLLAAWRPDAGVVCSVPIAARPENFWAELECGFLNTFQARWEYLIDTVGFGFAQGKSMLFRRDIIEAGGGIGALASDLAEDAATTKLVRAQGRKVRLVDNPFEQPLGRRGVREVWARQVRWARLRRITFPLLFLPEILTGCLFPVLAGAYAASQFDFSIAAVVLGLIAVWFGAELGLARAAGWYLSWKLPLAFLVRDLLLPVLWVDAWLNDGIVWRGTRLEAPRAELPEAAGN